MAASESQSPIDSAALAKSLGHLAEAHKQLVAAQQTQRNCTNMYCIVLLIVILFGGAWGLIVLYAR